MGIANTLVRRAAKLAVGGLLFGLAGSAFSQGYRVTDGYTPDTATANAGPVRMARFSYVKGDVTWRPAETEDWSQAGINLPLRQGAEVWIGSGGRGEIQFDDGSDLRLGAGSLVTFSTMYSDSKGEFTEIKLNSGLANLRLRSNISLYQVDTPSASIKSYGPARFRFGIDRSGGLEVTNRVGEVLVSSSAGESTLQSSQDIYLAGASAQPTIAAAPPQDEWDSFCDQRDVYWDHPSTYLPSNIGLAAGNLDAYGAWRDDPQYGHIWCPRVTDAGWRPYSQGNWVWVSPFGWTWQGHEGWGWAPYHYGTWVHEPYGWGWSPGPAVQYWSPAVVQYTYYGSNVAWCPLAPAEVRYPAFSIGFGGGNWALSFSIGAAACYYPGGSSWCSPRPWNNVVINRTTNIYNVNIASNYYGRSQTANVWRTNNRFVPSNSRWGGTFASTSGFGGGGGFHALPGGQAAVFRTGRSFSGAPGGTMVSGPAGIPPTRGSFAVGHTFGGGKPPASLTQRSVVRAAVPGIMGQHSVGVGRTISPTKHRFSGTSARPGGSLGRPTNGGTARPGGSFGHPPTGSTAGPGGLGRPGNGHTSTARPGGSFGRPATGSTARPGGLGRPNNGHTSTARPGGSFGRPATGSTARPGGLGRPNNGHTSTARPGGSFGHPATGSTARPGGLGQPGHGHTSTARPGGSFGHPATGSTARPSGSGRPNTAHTNTARPGGSFGGSRPTVHTQPSRPPGASRPAVHARPGGSFDGSRPAVHAQPSGPTGGSRPAVHARPGGSFGGSRPTVHTQPSSPSGGSRPAVHTNAAPRAPQASHPNGGGSPHRSGGGSNKKHH